MLSTYLAYTMIFVGMFFLALTLILIAFKILDWKLMRESEAQYAQLRINPRDLKGMRETLCIAQSLLNVNKSGVHHVRRIQTIINEIDRHRPLGPDGKHGLDHTPTCGCEDK